MHEENDKSLVITSAMVEVRGKRFCIDLIRHHTSSNKYRVITHKLRIGENPDEDLYYEAKHFEHNGIFNIFEAQRYFRRKLSELKGLSMSI